MKKLRWAPLEKNPIKLSTEELARIITNNQSYLDMILQDTPANSWERLASRLGPYVEELEKRVQPTKMVAPSHNIEQESTEQPNKENCPVKSRKKSPRIRRAGAKKRRRSAKPVIKWRNTAELVAAIRSIRKLSREKFAAQLGVSKQFIYKLENGMSPMPKRMATRLEKIHYSNVLACASATSEDVYEDFIRKD